jgi:quercetin dioxygenase-like cupin family protein
MEVLHLEIRGDAPVQVEASPGEWHVQVLEGVTNVEIMGNTIELEPDRLALLPPNIQFNLVSGSRHGTCVVLIHAPSDHPAELEVVTDDEDDDEDDA